MNITDLTVEVRDSTLARVGQLLPADLVGAQFVLRHNKVGSWKVLLPSGHPMAEALRLEGAGLIVTGPSGVLLSGPTQAATHSKTAEDPQGVWTITGTDDLVLAGERIAYPTPTTADLTAQVDDYDVRTGAAETVAKEYVDANMGAAAPVARQVPGLTVEADLARGATVTGRARFDTIGKLLEQLLAPAGLGFRIRQDADALLFQVYEPADRTATVRLDVDNQRLSKSEYSYTAPTVTRAIVAGQGTGAARTLVEVTDTEAEAAEAAWGRRIERFKDQRNTDDTTELEQAGSELLAEGGRTIEAVSVTPSDDQTMRYGVDWDLGDRVSVVVDTQEVAQVVTEVAFVVTTEGVKIGATVGDPYTAAADETTALAATAADQEQRISNLERNEPAASGGGTSGPVAWADVTGKPSTFTPSTHASTHAAGGSDAITVAQSQVTGLSTALAGKVDTTDSRLSDARTPTAHTHAAADVTSGQLAVARGGTGAGDAATARANLAAVGVYAQSTEPTGGNIGDLWIDTSSNQNTIGAVPRFEATRTTDWTVTTGADYTLAGFTQVENVGGFAYNSTTGLVTVPLTGRYAMYAYVRWNSATTGRRGSYLVRNNTTTLGGTITAAVNGTRQIVAIPSMRLTAGDTVQVDVYQDSGASVATNFTTTNPFTFVLEYLGS